MRRLRVRTAGGAVAAMLQNVVGFVRRIAVKQAL
jgi:hypothetical protein